MRISNQNVPVVAGIASIPWRSHSLEIVLKSIWNQVDHVEIVLNGYDEVPSWLESKKFSIVRSQDIGDYADNAKFYGIAKYNDCVYFSIDDDILYPSDYVPQMLRCLDKYESRAAVGVHGCFLPCQLRNFLKKHTLPFWRGLNFDVPCSYVGTGTLVVTRNILPESPLSIFSDTGISDLYLANWFKQQDIPVVCVHRRHHWLKQVTSSSAQPSLWHKATNDHSRHDLLIQSESPWGVEDLLSRCGNGVLEHLPYEIVELLEFCCDIEQRTYPSTLAEIIDYTIRSMKFLKRVGPKIYNFYLDFDFWCSAHSKHRGAGSILL